MNNLYKRVALFGNVELRKNSNGEAAVYVSGVLKYSGKEYFAGRFYINLKADAWAKKEGSYYATLCYVMQSLAKS